MAFRAFSSPGQALQGREEVGLLITGVSAASRPPAKEAHASELAIWTGSSTLLVATGTANASERGQFVGCPLGCHRFKLRPWKLCMRRQLGISEPWPGSGAGGRGDVTLRGECLRPVASVHVRRVDGPLPNLSPVCRFNIRTAGVKALLGPAREWAAGPKRPLAFSERDSPMAYPNRGRVSGPGGGAMVTPRNGTGVPASAASAPVAQARQG